MTSSTENAIERVNLSDGTYVEMLNYVPWGLRKRAELKLSGAVRGMDPAVTARMMQAKTNEDRMDIVKNELISQVDPELLFDVNLMLTKGLIKKCVYKGEEMEVELFLETVPEQEFGVVFARVTELSKPVTPEEKKSLLKEQKTSTKVA